MTSPLARLGGDPVDSRLVRRFGHRGAALIIIGFGWIIFGATVLVQPTSARPWVFHELLPLPLRAGLWATCGLVALAYGFRGAEHDDTVGMVALMVMPLERFVSFLVSYLAFGATWLLHGWFPEVEVTGYSDGWFGASIWLVIVTLLRLVAGWPNPRQVLPVSSGGADDD